MDRGPGGEVEIRRFNETNVLIEQEAPSVEVYVVGATFDDYALMIQRVQALESEVASLKQKVAAGASKRSTPTKARGKRMR